MLMSKGNVEITRDKDSEHFDVLIVGAGISGVAAGVYLNKYCPSENFLILEAEASYGGTWWTHRSPGIRSDSDLHTFGYSFKPWVGPPIATAYMRQNIAQAANARAVAEAIRQQQIV